MAQTLERAKINYEHFFVGPEGQSVTEVIKLTGDHLTVDLKSLGRPFGRLEKRGREVLEDSRPPWHRLPDERTMDAFNRNRIGEIAALAVLVSTVNRWDVLARYGMGRGTYTRFSNAFLPGGAQPEAFLRENALGGLLDENTPLLSLGCTYVPETGGCMHIFQLMPVDFLHLLDETGMPKGPRDEVLKKYFAQDGYHSARALMQTSGLVQMMAREYESLRLD